MTEHKHEWLTLGVAPVAECICQEQLNRPKIERRINACEELPTKDARELCQWIEKIRGARVIGGQVDKLRAYADKRDGK